MHLILQQSLYFTILYFKTTLDYKTTQFGPKMPLCVLNDLYFKATCNIRPHFLGHMVGLKIEGLLYSEQMVKAANKSHPRNQLNVSLTYKSSLYVQIQLHG